MICKQMFHTTLSFSDGTFFSLARFRRSCKSPRLQNSMTMCRESFSMNES